MSSSQRLTGHSDAAKRAARMKTKVRMTRRSSVSTKMQTRRTKSSPIVRDYERSVEPEIRAMFAKWASEQREITRKDVDQLLARVRAAIQPAPSVLDDHVGPFYDTSGLRSWTGTSRQAIHAKVQRNRLISCQLEDGSWVYPVWQFDGRGTAKPALVDVWRELRGPAEHPHADPWTCALWMRAPHPDLDGMTPVEWIEDGRPAEAVLELARYDAARWAR